MSVEHKRPLLAFIIVAVVCGVVIGHTLVTAAVPPAWNRPAAIVQGIVFQAAAAEPTGGHVFSPVAVADPVTVVPAVDPGRVASHQPVATHARHTTSRHQVARGTHQVRWDSARARWDSGHDKHDKHGKHGKHHGRGHGHHHLHGHGLRDLTLSLRWR